MKWRRMPGTRVPSVVTVHAFEVGLQKVGVFFEVLRRGLLASFAREGGGTDQSGDVRRQRRGRVTAGFLPAFLGT